MFSYGASYDGSILRMSENAAHPGVMSDAGSEILVDCSASRDDFTDASSDCEPRSMSSESHSDSSDNSSSDESCDCDECRGKAPSSSSSSTDEDNCLSKANMFALRWRANVTPSEV